MDIRYPFSPAVLDAIPEELAELFRGLELKLLEEICSRLKIANQLNEVTVQDTRALRAHGIDLEDIKKAISRATDIGADKLEKLLDDVVGRNQQYYTSMIDLAHVTAPERLVDHEDIHAIYKQTKGTYRNITQSMGFLVRRGRHRVLLPPAKAYQHCLDMAEMQIMSGAISYNQAIAEAVKQLADSGLKTVEYDSGYRLSVDSAVRMCVMTGVNQINQKYREQSMDYLETDLVETTAHLGARNTDGSHKWDNHEKWQGRWFRWKKYTEQYPNSSKGNYPDFDESCGPGSVTGIGGSRCRHSFYSVIEGVNEPTYSEEDLNALKGENHKFTFEGKEYDGYTATQKQRQIERTIRKLTRRKAAFEAAGLTEDTQAANSRLRRLNEEYRKFSKAAGLPELRERMKASYVDDASAKEAAALKVRRDAEAPIREAIRRGDYPLTINPEKQARHMVGTALPSRSVITVSQEELQSIIDQQAGSGKLDLSDSLAWNKREIVDAGKEIGYTINANGDIIIARSIKIHYSKTGVHAVPFSGRWRK